MEHDAGETGEVEGDADDEVAEAAEPAVDPVQAAREAFGRGVEHMQARGWALAEREFRAALALHVAPAIQVNLAAVLVEQGRFREAHGVLLEAEADPELPENLAAPIAQLRERMGREAGQLRITRSGAAEGAAVVLDAERVEEEWLLSPIPVAPGAHRVTAERAGETLATVEVDVAAGERAAVALGLSERLVEGPEQPGESDDTGLIVGLSVAGGAVLVAAIVIIAVVAASGGGDQPFAGDFMPGLIAWR